MSLMVCVLTATLTSYWTANTVKDMLKKFPRSEPSSTQTRDNDLGATMTDDRDLAATMTSSPATSPPRSPRNQRRNQESENGFEVVGGLVEGGEEREDPQPNPGGEVAGPGVDDAVRDRLYEWMDENIAAPLRAQGAQIPTAAQQTPQVLTAPQQVPQVPVAPQQIPQVAIGQRHAHEQVCVFPLDVVITDSRVAWFVVSLEECEGLAWQKQFKEAADLAVNAVPLNLARPFR